MWGRDVIPKTKTHIYHAVVKSTITYAAETRCLKAKNGSKTKFHRNGRFGDARLEFPGRKKLEKTVVKQKMNTVKSILDDIKTKQLQCYGYVQRTEEAKLPKDVVKWRPPGRRKRGRPKLTWAKGIRGLMGEMGLMGEDWNDRGNWREKIM